MHDPELDEFMALTPDEQSRWLRRETWKARLLSIAGWTLFISSGLLMLLVVFKTLVIYGPLQAFFAVLFCSAMLLLPSVIRTIWEWITEGFTHDA